MGLIQGKLPLTLSTRQADCLWRQTWALGKAGQVRDKGLHRPPESSPLPRITWLSAISMWASSASRPSPDLTGWTEAEESGLRSPHLALLTDQAHPDFLREFLEMRSPSPAVALISSGPRNKCSSF